MNKMMKLKKKPFADENRLILMILKSNFDVD